MFEIRIEFTPFNFHELMMWLAATTGTITSPGFHSFVLVVDDAHCPSLFGRADELEASRLVDQTLWNLSQRTGMKMIVRQRTLWVNFRNEMVKAFPLMSSAGVIKFKLDDPPPLLHYTVLSEVGFDQGYGPTFV